MLCSNRNTTNSAPVKQTWHNKPGTNEAPEYWANLKPHRLSSKWRSELHCPMGRSSSARHPGRCLWTWLRARKHVRGVMEAIAGSNLPSRYPSRCSACDRSGTIWSISAKVADISRFSSAFIADQMCSIGFNGLLYGARRRMFTPSNSSSSVTCSKAACTGALSQTTAISSRGSGHNLRVSRSHGLHAPFLKDPLRHS